MSQKPKPGQQEPTQYHHTAGPPEWLASPGPPVTEGALLKELAASREQIAQGLGIENEAARAVLAEWRKGRR